MCCKGLRDTRLCRCCGGRHEWEASRCGGVGIGGLERWRADKEAVTARELRGWSGPVPSRVLPLIPLEDTLVGRWRFRIILCLQVVWGARIEPPPTPRALTWSPGAGGRVQEGDFPWLWKPQACSREDSVAWAVA